MRERSGLCKQKQGTLKGSQSRRKKDEGVLFPKSLPLFRAGVKLVQAEGDG
jgi:hypothetical protein